MYCDASRTGVRFPPPPFFPLGALAQGLPPLSLAIARFTPLGGSNWRTPCPLDSLRFDSLRSLVAGHLTPERVECPERGSLATESNGLLINPSPGKLLKRFQVSRNQRQLLLSAPSLDLFFPPQGYFLGFVVLLIYELPWSELRSMR